MSYLTIEKYVKVIVVLFCLFFLFDSSLNASRKLCMHHSSSRFQSNRFFALPRAHLSSYKRPYVSAILTSDSNVNNFKLLGGIPFLGMPGKVIQSTNCYARVRISERPLMKARGLTLEKFGKD